MKNVGFLQGLKKNSQLQLAQVMAHILAHFCATWWQHPPAVTDTAFILMCAGVFCLDWGWFSHGCGREMMTVSMEVLYLRNIAMEKNLLIGDLEYICVMIIFR